MNRQATVFFRVDASLEMGSGHLMRCLTLADALSAHGARATFVSRHLPDALEALVRTRGHRCLRLPARPAPDSGGGLTHGVWLGATQAQDALDTSAAIDSDVCDWLVVDHYGLDAEWEGALRARTRKILAVDDLADRRHDCDTLLDQNLYAGMADRYVDKVPPGCLQLLGPRYALLRPEFAQARLNVTIRSGVVRRILVFFGGMDATNATGAALSALKQAGLRDCAIDVVIGAQHPAREQIEADCRRLRFTCHVQTQRMAELMASADLAIGAGGSTTWERCCLGLPTITCVLAENQRQLVEDGANAGILIPFPNGVRVDGDFVKQLLQSVESASRDPGVLVAVSRAGMALVKGDGTDRVRRVMGISGLVMRQANASDSERLFRWRNHHAIRAVSRNKEPIAWQDHQRWLAGMLDDPQRVLLIGAWRGADIGVARFDLSGDEAEISVYLNPELRLQGWGIELLQGAECFLRDRFPAVRGIRAEVLPGNAASQRLFERNGYQGGTTIYFKRLGP